MRANVSKHAQVAFGQKGVEGIFGINLEHPPFVDPYGHRRLLKAEKPHFCKSGLLSTASADGGRQ